jgi:hypothetical protein
MSRQSSAPRCSLARLVAAVFAEWDQGSYPTGITVTNAELAAVPVEPHTWHGEWNYTIPVKPPPRPRRSNN